MNNNDARNVAISLLENEIEKLTQAYQKGYEKGVEDTKAAMAEYAPKSFVDEDGIEWVDMSLPSGTLWSKPLTSKDGKSLLSFTFNEANKYDLPTLEEVAELNKFTGRTLPNNEFVDCKSIDDQHIVVHISSFFWTSEEKDATIGHCYNSHLQTTWFFKGDRKNVMLVKRKK